MRIKPIKSHSANKIDQSKKIISPKNILRSSTSKVNKTYGSRNMINKKNNIYEEFCKELLKQHKLNNIDELKIFINTKITILQKDKEKINAVKLLLEKSILNENKII